MDESPIRKKTQPKKPAAAKKPTSRAKKAVPAGEALKETLLEVRGLEASILEDVVIDPAAVPEVPVEEPTVFPEQPAEPVAEESAPQPTEELTAAPVVPRKPRKKRRRKRRKVPYAAPLGFMVLLLAIVGIIALIVSGIRLVKKAADDSELRADLAEFMNPVTQMFPDPFTDAGQMENQDSLIRSAIYSLSQPENVRRLNEGEDCKYSYERDDLGNLIIPQKKVEQAFAALFGDKKIQSHHTVGDANYNEQTGCYHVPVDYPTAGSVPVLDTIKRDGDLYTVRVAYVLLQDIQYDYRGEKLEPTADMGKVALLFTVQKNEDDSWTILAVKAEEPKTK